MSLIVCPECSHTVSDKAFSCPGCGYPVACSFPDSVPLRHESYLPAKKTKPAAVKRKKLPNGYGTIKKLSGNRSRPYAAYPPASGYESENGPLRIPAIGYFKDWHSAYDALSEYHHKPYNIRSRSLTFANVYELYYKEKFITNRKALSTSSRYAYESAFKNCPKLHELRFYDIRKSEMQEIVDTCELGYSSICNLKKLFCQLYRFAIENDIVEKDYAQFVTINREDDNEKGEPFSPEELALLWKNKDNTTVQMILIMIYSGFRIRAFENIEINRKELYFKGGVKTAAGKGRIVPIHKAIQEFVFSFNANFPNFKTNTFRACHFYPTLEQLGISTTASGKKHTPHDCRHTFSWLCDKYKVDELSKHMLMGHSLGKDVEKSVYGHRTLDELRAEIGKIQV